jgi:putative SbcD/Mre11-related phosphoesterase
MASVEPVPNAPVAVVETGTERVLALADVHAGYESWLRREEGVHVDSDAERRRERVLGHLAATDVDRLVVLGDLAHFYGGPGGAERGEIEVLLEAVTERVPVTVVKGNHDGGIEEAVPDAVADRVTVTATDGVRMGAVGFVHGHTWPVPAVLEAEVVCIGHEHPNVLLTDDVGGRRTERAWLRGPLDDQPFVTEYDALDWSGPELVVFPAFNDRLGGGWVNEGFEFLSPFLPAGLPAADAYLLDGTRLGDYQRV